MLSISQGVCPSEGFAVNIPVFEDLKARNGSDAKLNLEYNLLGDGPRLTLFPASLLPSLELSDTKVYQP